MVDSWIYEHESMMSDGLKKCFVSRAYVIDWKTKTFKKSGWTGQGRKCLSVEESLPFPPPASLFGVDFYWMYLYAILPYHVGTDRHVQPKNSPYS